jgi:hypothetical protein
MRRRLWKALAPLVLSGVSALAGWLLQKYTQRPQPYVSITSVGLALDDHDTVSLSDEIIEAFTQSAWLDSQKAELPAADALTQLANVHDLVRDLTVAKDAVVNWESSPTSNGVTTRPVPAASQPESEATRPTTTAPTTRPGVPSRPAWVIPQLDNEALFSWGSRHQSEARQILSPGPTPSIEVLSNDQDIAIPYLRLELVARRVRGLALSSAQHPPISLAQVLRFPRLSHVTLEESPPSEGQSFRTELIINTGEYATHVSVGKDPEERDALLLLVESMARGIAPNVRYYLAAFDKDTQAELPLLAQLNSRLRSLIASRRRLLVNVNLFNSGGTAIAFRPFARLRFTEPDWGAIKFTLRVDSKPPDQAVTPSLNDPDLPPPALTQYVVVPPREVRAARFISEPLGDDGEPMLDNYKLNTQTFRVAALTTDGQFVWSTAETFGSEVATAELEALDRADSDGAHPTLRWVAVSLICVGTSLFLGWVIWVQRQVTGRKRNPGSNVDPSPSPQPPP